MGNIFDSLDTKSKEFEDIVSVVVVGATAGIAISKAIKKNEKIGAVIGIGIGLVIYKVFSPQDKLKVANFKLEKKIEEFETKRLK